MKRALSISICVFILQAAAAWALAACEGANFAAAGHHHSDKHPGQRGSAHPESSHSHSDPVTIHCANFFGEFVLTARVSLDPVRKVATLTSETAWQGGAALFGKLVFLRIHGPPIPIHASSDSRYLLLSVIRI